MACMELSSLSCNALPETASFVDTPNEKAVHHRIKPFSYVHRIMVLAE